MSEWISVKDRLPEIDVPVLVASTESAIPIVAMLSEATLLNCDENESLAIRLTWSYAVDDTEWIRKGWVRSGAFTIAIDIGENNIVTHWMPLPKKPKQKTMWIEDKNHQRVWIVLEEDRGCGASVVGVFLSADAAKAFLRDPSVSSGSCYLSSEEGELIKKRRTNEHLP